MTNEVDIMAAESIVFGKDFFIINPSRTALIIIDMQNAFVAEDGTYQSAEARQMVPRLEKLIAFAREHRLPLIWTQSDHRPPYGGILLRKFPAIREDRVLWKGDPSFELYADMPQPLDDEYRVVKHKYDAFFETDLDAILRNKGITTVIITGTATNVCCESTARSAFFRDYNVVFPSDCNGTFDPEMQAATLKTIDMFFGRVLPLEELLTEMAEVLPAARAGQA
jgi:ureidoacrylate peracid hydrolase